MDPNHRFPAPGATKQRRKFAPVSTSSKDAETRMDIGCFAIRAHKNPSHPLDLLV